MPLLPDLEDHYGDPGSGADSQLSDFLSQNLGTSLTDEDFHEISDSLFYLGRAIDRYCQQKEAENAS